MNRVNSTHNYNSGQTVKDTWCPKFSSSFFRIISCKRDNADLCGLTLLCQHTQLLLLGWELGASGTGASLGGIYLKTTKAHSESWAVSEPGLGISLQTWCNECFHTENFFISLCIGHFSVFVSCKKSLALMCFVLGPSVWFCIFNWLTDTEILINTVC